MVSFLSVAKPYLSRIFVGSFSCASTLGTLSKCNNKLSEAYFIVSIQGNMQSKPLKIYDIQEKRHYINKNILVCKIGNLSKFRESMNEMTF